MIQKDKSNKQTYILSEQSTPGPSKYHQLIEMVGDDGIYQKLMVVFFLIPQCMVTSIIYATSFFFKQQSLNCEELNVSQDMCQAFICEHQKNNILLYTQNDNFFSLADQFGPFYCGQAHKLILFRLAPNIGMVLSLIILIIADNIGRKTANIIAYGVCCSGMIITLFSPSMEFAFLGMAMIGTGVLPGYRITYLFMNQFFNNQKRQKYAMILIIISSSWLAFVGFFFYLLRNWKLVMIYTMLIPSFVYLLFTIFFIQQTPLYSIRKSKEKAIQSLNWIAQMNKGQENIINLEHIQKVLKNQQSEHSQRKASLFDLCRYKSLRFTTIGIILLVFSKAFLNYGPLAILDKMGINIFVNAIGIGIIQAIATVPIYFYIQTLPRVLVLRTLVISGIIVFFCLIFIQNTQDQFSWQNITQFIMLLISRVSISIYFSMVDILIAETYPTKVRGIGQGISSSVNAFSGIIANLLTLQLQKQHINPSIVMFSILFLGLGGTFLIPESVGLQLQTEIEQLRNKPQNGKLQNA